MPPGFDRKKRPMLGLPGLELLLVQAFALLLLWGATSDLQSFLIPNRVSLAVALLYPAYVLTAPHPVDWLAGCGAATVVFLVGAVAFARGWFGGGDVKLLAAAALWAGPGLLPSLLLVTGAAGGLLGLIVLAQPVMARWRPGRLGLAGPAVEMGKGNSGLQTKIPYGVAIAAGGLFVAVQLLLS